MPVLFKRAVLTIDCLFILFFILCRVVLYILGRYRTGTYLRIRSAGFTSPLSQTTLQTCFLILYSCQQEPNLLGQLENRPLFPYSAVFSKPGLNYRMTLTEPAYVSAPLFKYKNFSKNSTSATQFKDSSNHSKKRSRFYHSSEILVYSF